MKENSSQSSSDLTLSILECITSLIRGRTRYGGGNVDGGDDSEQATTAWYQCEFMSIERVAKEKDICAGHLDGHVLNSSQYAANLGNGAISVSYFNSKIIINGGGTDTSKKVKSLCSTYSTSLLACHSGLYGFRPFQCGLVYNQ